MKSDARRTGVLAKPNALHKLHLLISVSPNNALQILSLGRQAYMLPNRSSNRALPRDDHWYCRRRRCLALRNPHVSYRARSCISPTDLELVTYHMCTRPDRSRQPLSTDRRYHTIAVSVICTSIQPKPTSSCALEALLSEAPHTASHFRFHSRGRSYRHRNFSWLAIALSHFEHTQTDLCEPHLTIILLATVTHPLIARNSSALLPLPYLFLLLLLFLRCDPDS